MANTYRVTSQLIPMLAPAAIDIEAQAMAVFGGGVKKSEMHAHS